MAMKGKKDNQDNDDDEKKIDLKSNKGIQLKKRCLGGCGKTQDFEWAKVHGKDAFFSTKENGRNGWCTSCVAKKAQAFNTWCYQNKGGIEGQFDIRWNGDKHTQIKRFGGPMTPIDAIFTTEKGTHIRCVQIYYNIANIIRSHIYSCSSN